MALQSGQYLRGGANGGVTDADGRRFAIGTGGIGVTSMRSVSQVSPTGSNSVCLLSPLNPGIYRLRGIVALTGTAETSLLNVRVRADAVAVTSGTSGGHVPTLSGLVVPFEVDRVTVVANVDLFIPAAAVVGSIYNLTLVATRVE